MMNELLLLLILVLSAHYLTRITNLIIVLVVLVLLYSLIWLPATCFSFVIPTIAETFIFKSRSLLIHHHLLVLRICHLCHIGKLRLLLLVWRWIVYNLFWKHHESLWLHLIRHNLLLLNRLSVTRYELTVSNTDLRRCNLHPIILLLHLKHHLRIHLWKWSEALTLRILKCPRSIHLVLMKDIRPLLYWLLEISKSLRCKILLLH